MNRRKGMEDKEKEGRKEVRKKRGVTMEKMKNV